MANFLDTFEACIESFFTAKKAWIAEQALPNGEYSSSTITATGDYVEVVAPISGYAVVRINTAPNPDQETIRLRITCDGLGASTFKLSSGVADQYVPCKKGQTVSYMSSNGQQSTLIFVESVATG